MASARWGCSAVFFSQSVAKSGEIIGQVLTWHTAVLGADVCSPLGLAWARPPFARSSFFYSNISEGWKGKSDFRLGHAVEVWRYSGHHANKCLMEIHTLDRTTQLRDLGSVIACDLSRTVSYTVVARKHLCPLMGTFSSCWFPMFS